MDQVYTYQLPKQQIILLSGFGGTGKTTIGNHLNELLENNALIEADELFHIKPFEIGDKMGRIKLKNSLDVMTNFLKEGYQQIICIGLVWSQAELDAVINEFPGDSYKHFLFRLHASKEVRFQRVVNRAEPGDTLEWLEKVEQTILNPWPFRMNIGQVVDIDTTSKSPIDVAQQIMRLIA
jgi:predicted kinase